MTKMMSKKFSQADVTQGFLVLTLQESKPASAFAIPDSLMHLFVRAVIIVCGDNHFALIGRASELQTELWKRAVPLSPTQTLFGTRKLYLLSGNERSIRVMCYEITDSYYIHRHHFA